MDVDNVVKNLDDKQIKSTIESAIEAMEKQQKALNSRLAPHQQEVVKNHISKLRE